VADKYDRAMKYLTEKPHEIPQAWSQPYDHKAGCLFTYVGEEVLSASYDGRSCGCLTQVRGGIYHAQTLELTVEIEGDTRIPDNPNKITVADLPVFAEWQRRIDKELGRA
jgi:hypothetical protein